MARRIALALLVAFVGVAAACGGDDDESQPAPAPAPAETGAAGAPTTEDKSTTLDIAADPGGALAFDTTSLAAPAGKVTIRFTNDSSVPHNVTIDGPGVEDEGTETITGSSTEATLDLDTPGTYTFYCSVGQHRAASMEGTLTVE